MTAATYCYHGKLRRKYIIGNYPVSNTIDGSASRKRCSAYICDNPIEKSMKRFDLSYFSWSFSNNFKTHKITLAVFVGVAYQWLMFNNKQIWFFLSHSQVFRNACYWIFWKLLKKYITSSNFLVNEFANFHKVNLQL